MKLNPKVLLVLGSLIFSLLLIEGILTVANYRYLPLKIEKLGQLVDGVLKTDMRNFHMYEDKLFTYDPELIWRTRKNYGPFNSQGFVGKELPPTKGANDYYVFAIGDSNTFGFTEPNGFHWPGYLEKLLQEHMPEKNVTVINAGAPGYTLFQGERYFRQILSYKPDAVFVAFGGNDAHRVTVPDREYLATRKIFSYASFLRTAQLAMQAYDRVLAKSDEPLYQPRVSVVEYKQYLGEIIETAKAKGIKAVLLTRPYAFPSTHPLWWKNFTPAYREATLQTAAEKGVPVIDIHSYFKDRTDLFVPRDESHFSDKGYRIMADIIYREITQYLP